MLGDNNTGGYFLMSVKIFYNNTDFFSNNNLPTPAVSRSSSSISFGEKVGDMEVIELSGTAYLKDPPSNCNYLQELNNLRDSLFEFFSEDFKSLHIEEDGVKIFERDFCTVSNIEIPDSTYNKTFEYKIVFNCYDESIHNEHYGIINPKSLVSIEKTEDEIYIISRNCSATGINLQDSDVTDDNSSSISSSLSNAIDFVKSKTNENFYSPEGVLINAYLIEKNETIDRVKNFYGVQEVFKADKNNNSSTDGILRYTISKDESFGGIYTITINGVLQFGVNSDVNDLRQRFSEINLFEELKSKIDTTGFFERFQSLNINEDLNNKAISFDATYNNDKTFDECGVSTKINHTITEKGKIVDVNTTGTIEARGPKEKRWESVKNVFYNKSYDENSYSSWVNQKAQENLNENYSGITLYKYPESKKITENQKNGIINFEYNFSNRHKIENFKNFQCNLTVNMPTPKYSVDMNFGGSMDSYIVSRSGFSKGSVQVNVSGVYKKATTNRSNDRESALNLIKNEVENRMQEVINLFFANHEGIIVDSNYNYINESNQITYSETRDFFKDVIK